MFIQISGLTLHIPKEGMMKKRQQSKSVFLVLFFFLQCEVSHLIYLYTYAVTIFFQTGEQVYVLSETVWQ